MPNMAITACMPAGKTEPCVAFMPSVRVRSKMRAAAESITISIMADMPSLTVSPSITKAGRKLSNEPKNTIKTVARIKISTDKTACRLLCISFISTFLTSR